MLKKVLPWVWLGTLIVMIGDWMYLGLEIFAGHMAPDVIITCAYIQLICLPIAAACALYRAWVRHQQGKK